MRNACLKAGLPEPEFEERQGFRVIFRKGIYTEEYLRQLGLRERQIKAVMYVKEKGRITNKEYRVVSGLSDEGARIDLKVLVEKGIIKQKGRGRSVYYILK